MDSLRINLPPSQHASAPPGHYHSFYLGNDQEKLHWRDSGFQNGGKNPQKPVGRRLPTTTEGSKGSPYSRSMGIGENRINLTNSEMRNIVGIEKTPILRSSGDTSLKHARRTSAGRSRRTRIRRTPRWMSVIKTSSALHLSMSCSLGIFGIGVAPIWQGLFGILCSMEGYLGVVSYNTTRVKLFILGLVFSFGMSLAVGALAVIGLPVGVINPVEVCQKENTGTASRGSNDTILFIDPNNPCAASYQMYGIVELGMALLSSVLIVVVSLSYQAMKWDCKELQLAKENEYETFYYG